MTHFMKVKAALAGLGVFAWILAWVHFNGIDTGWKAYEVAEDAETTAYTLAIGEASKEARHAQAKHHDIFADKGF